MTTWTHNSKSFILYFNGASNSPFASRSVNNREFKKLRRLLQRERHIKLELCVRLSILRLFHVDHVVQNRRTALSLAWYEWFHVKAKSERFTAASSRCCQNLKYENFRSSFGRLRQNIAPKSVQHAYFSSFNQSNHWFVALSLTLRSSNLKLPYKGGEDEAIITQFSKCLFSTAVAVVAA